MVLTAGVFWPQVIKRKGAEHSGQRQGVGLSWALRHRLAFLPFMALVPVSALPSVSHVTVRKRFLGFAFSRA